MGVHRLLFILSLAIVCLDRVGESAVLAVSTPAVAQAAAAQAAQVASRSALPLKTAIPQTVKPTPKPSSPGVQGPPARLPPPAGAGSGGSSGGTGGGGGGSSSWTDKVGPPPPPTWQQRVQNSRTNEAGQQGRGRALGGDSRSSSGNIKK